VTEVLNPFWERSGLPSTARLPDVVEAIRSIPYGRASEATAERVVREWRGTCSTKHLLLAALVTERWPDADLRLVHRVYRVTPELAAARWPGAAASVPPGGLIDVHTYATVRAHGRRIRIDVTFPGAPWDGHSDMPLACGEGRDRDAGPDPMATKAALVRDYCEPAVREPFIAALGDAAR
jgi:hypothetical protein